MGLLGRKFDAALSDVVGALRPDLTREALGVSEAFPGITPNPLMSPKAARRRRELQAGEIALGTLADWRELSNEGSPRVALMLDVETLDGTTFRGIADEVLSITDLTRLAVGRRLPVRHRPAVQDHYVVLAEEIAPAERQRLAERFGELREA